MAKLFARLKKWRPGKFRPSFSLFNKKPGHIGKKAWRAKYYRFYLSNQRQVLITVRRFKTAPENRSKTYSQKVISLWFWPGKAKELAIRQKRYRRKVAIDNKAFNLQTFVSTLLIAGGIGSAMFFTADLFAGMDNQQPPASFNVPTPEAEADTGEDEDDDFLPPSKPNRLQAGAVGIDTGVMTVGKEADGTMEVPPLREEITGWYRHSPTPGEMGPSVIVGHVDNLEGPSVFWRLGELTPGDSVKVTREDGETVEFRVDEVARYEQADFPTKKVYGNTDQAELRLITCGGNFDYQTQRYTHNTVVYASMVGE